MTLAAASGWAVLWLSFQEQQAKGTSLCLLWEVAEIPCVKLGEVRVAPMQVDGAVCEGCAGDADACGAV